MDFTKCELISELKRTIDGARKRGSKFVTIPLEHFLLAIQLDRRGGSEQLQDVMDEISGSCNCHGVIETEGHWQQIAFVI